MTVSEVTACLGPVTPALPIEPHRPSPLQLAPGVNSGQGLGIEIIGTLQLVLCVLATTDRRRRDLGGSSPLAIGLSVSLGHLLAVSGGLPRWDWGGRGRPVSGCWSALSWQWRGPQTGLMTWSGGLALFGGGRVRLRREKHRDIPAIFLSQDAPPFLDLIVTSLLHLPVLFSLCVTVSLAVPPSLFLSVSPLFPLALSPSQIDYTGCGINPARSFGSSVITHNFKDHWVRGPRATPGKAGGRLWCCMAGPTPPFMVLSQLRGSGRQLGN